MSSKEIEFAHVRAWIRMALCPERIKWLRLLVLSGICLPTPLRNTLHLNNSAYGVNLRGRRSQWLTISL